MEPEHTTGYYRDAFGYAGTRVRAWILNHERRDDGSWFSRWDGRFTSDPSTLDIDHTVALKEAWDSGAWAWSENKRRTFANDEVNPFTLNAITSSLNRSKSDQDGAWAAPANRCQYVQQVAWIKTFYGLSVDPDEKRVMLDVARRC
ncbi:DUF1524 domain-containing protein [Streptomyces sp. NPDC015131]|uniref:GmrSD restriction endonuclease domain-containing protein n=1 Tax=Streptomyces sp. NPDC015131 TaxID=3364941 RepID=UPI0036FD9CAF